jgi:hypothetical protein
MERKCHECWQQMVKVVLELCFECLRRVQFARTDNMLIFKARWINDGTEISKHSQSATIIFKYTNPETTLRAQATCRLLTLTKKLLSKTLTKGE